MPHGKALVEFLTKGQNIGQPGDVTAQLRNFDDMVKLLVASHLEVLHSVVMLEENLKALQRKFGDGSG
jgi:hypothetical protein